jgi:hypothetical protein
MNMDRSTVSRSHESGRAGERAACSVKDEEGSSVRPRGSLSRLKHSAGTSTDAPALIHRPCV